MPLRIRDRASVELGYNPEMSRIEEKAKRWQIGIRDLLLLTSAICVLLSMLIAAIPRVQEATCFGCILYGLLPLGNRINTSFRERRIIKTILTGSLFILVALYFAYLMHQWR
jgi:hypothetical protein